MRNKLVLIVLLFLPILIYLVFASATHNSLFLPTISRNNEELPKWESYDTSKVVLTNKITVLGFVGNNVLKNQGNLFNLNQKIYGKYVGFKDFQIVMIAQDGSQKQVKALLEKFSAFTENIKAWHFVFAKPNEIQAYYDSFKLREKLDKNGSTSNVIIIDKDRSHRGRKGKDKDGKNQYKEGYNTTSAADLHNEMTDDVKIMLREYRLALKRNNKRKDFHLHENK
jgi:glycosyltransferase involved in cell wall biosynthesis